MNLRMIYITSPNENEAASLGRKLVEERLAACANVHPGIQSIYHWEGKVQEQHEAVLILKTRAEQVEALIERARALHSYDCPCIVSLPIESGNPDFLRWVVDESSAGGEVKG